MIKLIIITGSIFIWVESHACQCLKITVKKNFELSTVVFRGEVIAVDTLKQFDADLPKGAFRELHLATIKVDKFYKGKAQNDTLRVITGDSYGDCGYSFFTRTKFILYTIERDYSIIDSTILPGMDVIVSNKRYLYTDHCDRTTEEISKEDALLKQYLDKRKHQ